VTRTPGRISAKDQGTSGTGPPVIPDKRYFKIGEVCELTGVKQHVLRYWEEEFRFLHPQRAQSRQRLYRRADVEMVLVIRRLLKDEGFTISGARKALEQARAAGHDPDRKTEAASLSGDEILTRVKTELQDLQNILGE